MPNAVRTILVVTKTGQPSVLEQGRVIASWLAGRGIAVDVLENEQNAEVIPLNTAGARPDFILVLGGDGTILSVARKTFGSGVPLMGVNLGRLGFLTALAPDSWPEALGRILEHGITTSERMILSYNIERGGSVVREGWFINDLVVNRGAMARLVRLSVHAGGEFVSSFRADGLIVATPTGSTAYCVSAGGPLLAPGLEVFCVVPICPFLNDFRPLVLPSSADLTIIAEEEAAEVYLTCDGQCVFRLRPGDRITCSRAEHGLAFVDIPGATWLGTLRAKGFFTERQA